MEKSEQNNYPRGHFPLHLTITFSPSSDEGREGFSTIEILSQFIDLAQQRYDLALLSSPAGSPTHAEATCSVPFPDRERIRIDFNIFASDMEAIHGTGLYFHMESAF